jgi:hypothetical protein
MATGRKWSGKLTVPSRVLYVLGEGKASLLKRVQVWAEYYKITQEEVSKLNSNFRVSFSVPQMASKASVDNMLAELTSEGFNPEVIVIDTFARSFVGLDENSQQDTGMWVESADRLRNLGYTVIFLHHTKKSTELGYQYRGSSAIMGAMDTAMILSRSGDSGLVKLKITEQKDRDEGTAMYFNRVILKNGDNDDGSVVLVPARTNVDERFSPKEGAQYGEIDEQAFLQSLIENDSYLTDVSRAEALAEKVGISMDAAKKRIQRAKEMRTNDV